MARKRSPWEDRAKLSSELPGEETCIDRFHAMLAAEWEQPETAEMHGLLVLTYHAQHPFQEQLPGFSSSFGLLPGAFLVSKVSRSSSCLQ
ncbi:MAG: DUF5946 family protein [Actinomycetota bacterium]